MGLNARLNAAGGTTCVLLGSTAETLAIIRDRMGREFPRVEILEATALPFRASFGGDDGGVTDAVVERLNVLKPNVVWIGLSSPKQEKWAAVLRSRLDGGVIGPVGALFDFYAGRINRAPTFIQNIGFEWLWRWPQEPRRLWRRSVVSMPSYLARILAARLHAVRPRTMNESR
jgi:N-acetylglucosaminyldiphosphoundecaprenol N-acetyl-beta-D-mannosaminyltransferase